MHKLDLVRPRAHTMQQRAETVAADYGQSLRAGPRFSRRPPLGWRQVQAPVRTMAVVVTENDASVRSRCRRWRMNNQSRHSVRAVRTNRSAIQLASGT